jgi:DNA invertase Pin-like site-specific DNA recombinase
MNMANIEEAISYLESLGPGEYFTYTNIAEKFNCDRRTLSRRWQGISAPRKVDAEKRKNLNTIKEAELIKYISDLTARYLPPTR